VTVEIYQVDRYKRLLATIFLDGKDINLLRNFGRW
jgi:endonuclease YncB( thermonuclease family)